MDQDPDRALGAAEDAGDLGRATSRRRSAGRPPGGDRRAAGRRRARPRAASSRRTTVALDVERVGDDRRGRLERRLGLAAPARGARSATALRAIWKSQTRNVEAPSPSAGRARSSNRSRFGERGQERPLGGVLGLVVVAELVVGEAVHLGQVLPIEGLEPGRVRRAASTRRPVAVEVGEPGRALRPAASHSS